LSVWTRYRLTKKSHSKEKIAQKVQVIFKVMFSVWGSTLRSKTLLFRFYEIGLFKVREMMSYDMGSSASRRNLLLWLENFYQRTYFVLLIYVYNLLFDLKPVNLKQFLKKNNLKEKISCFQLCAARLESWPDNVKKRKKNCLSKYWKSWQRFGEKKIPLKSVLRKLWIL
jgi:hypothetical protein